MSRCHIFVVPLLFACLSSSVLADTPTYRERMGFTLTENAEGRVTVGAVDDEGLAAAANLRAGDIIMSADDHTAVSKGALARYLNSKVPGESILLTVTRDKQQVSIPLRLRPETAVKSGATAPGDELGMFGAFVIEKDDGKVVIAKVGTHTPADEAGLKKGDVILSLDDFQPTSLEDFARRIRKIAATANAGEELSIALVRDGKSKTLRLTVPHSAGRGSAAAKSTARSGVAVARIFPLDRNQLPDANLFLVFKDQGESTDVTVTGVGLPAGYYRLTIREFGDCGDLENQSAGEVFLHAAETKTGAAEGRAGDLGSIDVPEDGSVSKEINVAGLRLTGPNSVVGRAILVHLGRGQNDAPVGCGVIGIANPQRDDRRANSQPARTNNNGRPPAAPRTPAVR